MQQEEYDEAVNYQTNGHIDGEGVGEQQCSQSLGVLGCMRPPHHPNATERERDSEWCHSSSKNASFSLQTHDGRRGLFSLDKIPPHRGHAAEYACQWFWGFCERAMQEPSRSHAPPLKGGLRTSRVAPTCEGWEPNKGGDDLPASACGLYSNDRSAESDHANRVHPGHTPQRT